MGSINKGTKALLLVNFVFWLSANFIEPFWSIFLTSEFHLSLPDVGLAILAYFLTFALSEPVVGWIADKKPGFTDDTLFLFFGIFIRGLLLFVLSLTNRAWQIYPLLIAMGMMRGLVGPTYKSLFQAFINRKFHATWWGLDESLVNVAAAAGAGLGGLFAGLFGIRLVLKLAGVLTLGSSLLSLRLIKIIKTVD